MPGAAGELTIAENLAIAARRGKWRGLGYALAGQRTQFIFERIAELGIGLETRLDQPMGSLSGGQRQALALVMATLAPSSVVLLDEHTAALDPANAEFVLELTRSLAERFGLTVLMVTHSMRQALDLGTRTIMLHEGEIILDVRDPERRDLTVDDLVARFRRTRGSELEEDELLTG